MDVGDVLRELDTSLEGLPESVARKRFEKYGPNVIVAVKKKYPFLRFLRLFLSPLPLLLLGLSAVALFTGEIHGAEVIVLMVFLSTTLAFVQEYRSDKAAERLRSMVRTTAAVLRKKSEDAAGEVTEIALNKLVPGDVVHLAAGDLVPAD